MSVREALFKAEEAGVDLVEISPNAEPPVCRIMDYGKYLYEKSKSQKEQKKKQKVVQVKEIKFRPGTDEGDYQVKLRSLIRFLEELALTHSPSPPAILLLDEPDNHLDLDSKQLLEALLQDYQGTLLLVSHDDAFIANCNITHTLNLSDK